MDEHDEMGSPHLSKRQKIAHDDGQLTLRHDEYTIAWICALPIELTAARAMLDEIHEPLPIHICDSNTYTLGRIQGHNIVIACLPIDRYGTVNAANVVTNMKQTFTSIRVGLIVGIGGGVPSGPETDIRLGDIVVGTRVMQVDLGKIIGDGQLEHTGVPRFPDQILAKAVSHLRAKHVGKPSRIPSVLQQKLKGCGYGRPESLDRLFHGMYKHTHPQENCDQCDNSKTIKRRIRSSDDPVIHYGAIASGSQVIKSSAFRDKVARELKVICFEMEAAGTMDILPCLPIRGICDYSDSHKSKEWQKYAAATAAAYATELLQELPVTKAQTKETCRPFPEPDPSREQRQRVLDSLKFEQIDARKMDIKKAHAETCQWFLGHQDYKAWLDQRQLSQHRGFLWLSGKPGAGKSTIMKFAYLRMKKTCNKDAVTASFFFNARGGYLEKSIMGMYRSLLLQLLEGYSDLQRVLEDPDLVPSPSQDISLSLNALKDLLCTAVLALGQRSFTCFVDALDECDEQQVIDMIQYFEDLAGQSTAKGVQFRVCFSSRHYPYLSIRWGLRIILEHQPGHTKDLEAYVESRLQIRDPMLIEKLRPEILEKAAGVFMWVVLVVDILNKEYRRGAMSMKNKLAELPGSLSDLFKDMLQRDKENMEEFKLCIIWILCAKRPLKPRELYHALWSGLSLQDPDESEIPDASDREVVEDDLPKFQRYIISSSKGLADIANSTHKYQSVQFIHESVRDFLVKDKGLYDLWPELELDWKSPSHEILKQCCSFYMNHRAVRNSINILWEGDRSKSQAMILDKYPFLEYTRDFIFYHANAAAKTFPQNEFLSSFQISNWIKIDDLLEDSESLGYSHDTSLYYILAEQGSAELIRTRLKEDPNARAEINFCDISGQTPLLRALLYGYESVIRILLDHGAGVNTCDKYGVSPLLRAICLGHETVARILLDHGAEANARDTSGETPLSAASGRGYGTVIKILLDRGAEVNTHGKFGRTPLYNALYNGHETVARILLARGARPSSDTSFPTALEWALRRGYHEIAVIIIQRGGTVGPDIASRLRSHITHNFVAVARQLTENGFDMIVTGYEVYITAVRTAVLLHCPEIAKWLLRREPSIMSDEFTVKANASSSNSCLKCFVRAGSLLEVGFLIRCGVDPNAADRLFRRTALHWAATENQQSMVNALLENGSNPNLIDRSGQTPLHHAAKNGHEEVTRQLLDVTDASIIDSGGRTALRCARDEYHVGIVRLLLSSWGSSDDCTDSGGKTLEDWMDIVGR